MGDDKFLVEETLEEASEDMRRKGVGYTDRLAEAERLSEWWFDKATESWAQVTRLRQRLKEAEGLAEALDDAAEGHAEMLGYIDDFFKKKWDLPGYQTRARAALDRWRKGPTHEHQFLTDEDGAVHPCVCGEPWRKGRRRKR